VRLGVDSVGQYASQATAVSLESIRSQAVSLWSRLWQVEATAGASDDDDDIEHDELRRRRKRRRLHEDLVQNARDARL
jgi:hypothetical protein